MSAAVHRRQGQGDTSNVVVASLNTIAEGGFGIWLADYGRQRPPLTYIHSSNNRRVLISHGVFCRQGEEGAVTVEGVIVMSSLAIAVMNHGPSTVDTSLNFREAPTKGPLNLGATRNRTSATLH